jgi:hypothetical protein
LFGLGWESIVQLAHIESTVQHWRELVLFIAYSAFISHVLQIWGLVTLGVVLYRGWLLRVLGQRDQEEFKVLALSAQMLTDLNEVNYLGFTIHEWVDAFEPKDLKTLAAIEL